MKYASHLLVLFTAAKSIAAPITYEFRSFGATGTYESDPSGNNPQTVEIEGFLSGTITTDGALGDITMADITSLTWNATYASGSTSEIGIVRYIAQGLYATPTTLSLLPGGDIELDSQTFQFGPFFASDFSMAESGGGMTWMPARGPRFQAAKIQCLSGAILPWKLRPSAAVFPSRPRSRSPRRPSPWEWPTASFGADRLMLRAKICGI